MDWWIIMVAGKDRALLKAGVQRAMEDYARECSRWQAIAAVICAQIDLFPVNEDHVLEVTSKGDITPGANGEIEMKIRTIDASVFVDGFSEKSRQ